MISLSSYFKIYAYFEVFSLKKKCFKTHFVSVCEVCTNNFRTLCISPITNVKFNTGNKYQMRVFLIISNEQRSFERNLGITSNNSKEFIDHFILHGFAE